MALGVRSLILSPNRLTRALVGSGLALCVSVLALPASPISSVGSQTASPGPPALDTALRSGDDALVRSLIVKDVGAADGLFLRYLTLALESSAGAAPPSLAPAKRLAAEFFGLFNLDFELGALDFWGKADLTRKQGLLAILRDHFNVFREERTLDDHPLMPVGWEARLIAQFSSLADRYKALGFGRGELAARLRVSQLDPGQAEKVWEMAKRLDDPVGEAWAAYYAGIWVGETGDTAARHAVEAAAKLGLPRLHQLALTRLAWRALSRDDYEGHVGYFRKALAAIETIPDGEIMIGRWSRQRYNGKAWFHLVLWRAGELKNKAEYRGEFEKGLALARQSGGRPGELSYLIEGIPRSLEPGLFKDVETRAEGLARRMSDRGWLVRVLLAKADALKGTTESQTAIAAVSEASDLLRRMSERAHLAECLSRRAVLLAQASRFDEAARDFRESIGLFHELSFEDEETSTAWDAAYYCRPKPALAEGFFGLALAAAQKKGDDDLVSQILSERGKFRLALAPTEGVKDLQEALAYKEKANAKAGRPGPDLGLMGRIGQALSQLGRTGEAVDVQKQRAEAAKGREDRGAEADASFWLNQLYALDLGAIAEAASYANRYQALIDRADPAPGLNELNRLALVFSNIGQTARALGYWRKALEQAAIPGRKQFTRMLHSNLASAYLKIGDYDAALAELAKERDLIEATFESFHGPVDLQKAQWFDKAALVHILMGDTGQAIAEAQEAIRLEMKSPAGTETADYYSYFTPGDALALAGRTAEAISFYEARRDRAREIHLLADEREALDRLGRLFLRAGDLAKARESLLAAVEVARKPPFPQTGELALSLLALGELELASGDPTKADSVLAEALTVANAPDWQQAWRIERLAALSAAAGGRTAAAVDHFERAEGALERAVERFRPEEFQVRFGVDRLRVYDEHAVVLAEAAVSSGRPEDIRQALRVVERRRLQGLWDLMATGWVRLEPEAVPEQLRRVREVETELTAKQSILRAQYALAADKRDQALISRLEADLESAYSEHVRLLASLAQGTYRYSAPGGVAENLAARLSGSLKPGQALVEYLVGDDASYAFVVTTKGVQLCRLTISRVDLRRTVQGLLKPFYGLRTGNLDLARLAFDYGASHALYEKLWGPLEGLLAGAGHVFIVPDDILGYWPFEALVVGLPRASRATNVLFGEAETARFVLNDRSLSYLASATHLLDAGEPVNVRKAVSGTLLAMADPTALSETSTSRDDLNLKLRAAGLGQEFSALPRAAEEIAQIGAMFPKDRVTLLTGPSATESRYKALAGNYRFVHLATHAFAADKQPLHSTLILAPETGTGEDGVLEAYEILRYPLQARLVVLSACETALGPLGRGEGLVGLVAAFRQAGAHAVIATQWSIDESVAETMGVFYKSLTAGHGTAAALREAKLATLKRRLRLGTTEVSLAHPFFWAPFVLIGTD